MANQGVWKDEEELSSHQNIEITTEKVFTYLWSAILRFQHDRRVTELLDQAVPTLNGGIGDLGNLVAAESVPFCAAAGLSEFHDIQRIGEVDESITNVAAVRKVNAKVHEIVATEATPIDNFLQLGLCDLVGDVPQHNLATSTS